MLTMPSAPVDSGSISSEVSYVLCQYVNKTQQLQVARISNVPGWRLEEVVLPGQQLVFNALSNARLEVYANKAGVVTLIKEILCANLKAPEKKTRLTIA